MSQNTQQNNGNNNKDNENVKEFRLSWGLIIAFIIAVIFAGAGGLAGHFVGMTLESLQATSSANEILSAQALQQFNFNQTAKVMYDIGMEDFQNALTLPSLFTEIGALIGGGTGFWLGLHVEENREKKKIVFK